ncbi:RNA methyltransferase [Clostridium swellfunianum]|uniref:TrmH family RNA methyltransferase n=1 Tax=Clostridium swellfunianum TaxID=1367462 RepID=UPI00202F8613|nr:RNA methyltransferase [Clostridium swellfunianum]MCM0650610.1 RNA methyltransferase [Clostridium swellfunianum]
MEIIQSKDNNLIKETKKLKEKRYRTERKQFLVEGFRFVEEALKSSFKIPYLFLSEDAMDRWQSFNLEGKLQDSTKVYIVSESIFRLLSSTETPQGIIAVVCQDKAALEDKDGFYILADKLQDPGNMGTIIRSAHAAGAAGVIVTKGTVDVYNEKTLRSTMGSIFNIPIIEDVDLKITDCLKTKGFKLIVSSLEDSKNFYDTDLNQNIIIAVGNEGSGISQEIYKLADIKVKIPMPGNAESLNAGAAASIMLFEIVRQKLTIAN